jgi:hypothetical protein
LAVTLHVLLAIACGVTYRLLPVSSGERRLRWFVIAAVMLAVAGCVVAWATADEQRTAARLLRFYWFRMTDVMLPLGMALAWVGYGYWRAHRPGAIGACCLLAAAALATAHLGSAALTNAGLLSERSASPSEVAWRQTCQWVRHHTPQDACFLTPRLQSTFKWHAQRSEVVTWKDIPQNAAGIVEWWDRMQAVHVEGRPGSRDYRWLGSLAEHGPERLRELGQTYNADYLLVPSQPSLNLPAEHRNEWYTVYRLKEVPVEDPGD